MLVKKLLVSLGLLVAVSRGDENAPEQVHLAYTGVSSERIVGFVTPSPSIAVKSVVTYGPSPDKLNATSTGKSFVFGTDGHNFTIHNVKVKLFFPLQPKRIMPRSIPEYFAAHTTAWGLPLILAFPILFL